MNSEYQTPKSRPSNKFVDSITKINSSYMGRNARKPVFGGLGTTQAQTSLRICTVWLAPLSFAFWKVSYVNLLRWNFNFLASLCNRGDWFETCFVGHPEDRFSREEAIWYLIIKSFNHNFCEIYWTQVLCNQENVPCSWTCGPCCYITWIGILRTTIYY